MSFASLFGFETEAANGKTGDELDRQREAAIAVRNQRRQAEINELRDLGSEREARENEKLLRDFERQRAENYQREGEALLESPYDEFSDAVSERASAIGDAGDAAIAKFLKTIFQLIPWYVWLGILAYVAWQLGLFKRRTA